MPPRRPSKEKKGAASAQPVGLVPTLLSKEECGECGCVVTTFSDGRVEIQDVSLEIILSLGMSYEKGVCGSCGRVKYLGG